MSKYEKTVLIGENEDHKGGYAFFAPQADLNITITGADIDESWLPLIAQSFAKAENKEALEELNATVAKLRLEGKHKEAMYALLNDPSVSLAIKHDKEWYERALVKAWRELKK